LLPSPRNLGTVKAKAEVEEDALPFKMEDLTNLCKRKGFVFQSSEIYSPMPGFFDYGPLGVELKNNIKKLWWRDMVQCRDDVVGARQFDHSLSCYMEGIGAHCWIL
jgi:hypothetical protein